MSRYASQTSVSTERSRNEIERTLQRYGAAAFMYGNGKDANGQKAIIQFEMNERRIRFVLPLPAEEEFQRDRRGARRHRDSQLAAWEQSCRQRWRALSLAVKAKLEAVASGITSFEEEFMAHIVLPNGATVGGWMLPQIQQAYAQKKMPPMLGPAMGVKD